MSDKEVFYHIPALLKDSIDGLNIQKKGVYVDVTFGGGGHSRSILAHLGKSGRLYAFDQDADAALNIIDDERFTFVRSNFRYISNFLRFHKAFEIDGILADLGVSSHHFDDEERGFSFRFDGELDMRMNKQAEKTACDVLNAYSVEKLSDVFSLYGELKEADKIAFHIVRQREKKPLQKTSDLLEILKPFCRREKEKKFLAQAFQALRIEVNDEMSALRKLLSQAEKLLRTGGRLVVISYHSLEDRLVKNFMKTGNFEGRVKQDVFGNFNSSFKPVGKMIVPTEEEAVVNTRARSAKLRIAEKIETQHVTSPKRIKI
ncbi:MAG: 16S rRNA (cytosine(1402)-N(4))-methyltransferase RsmH [Tannerella sp.]|jgi:16S rRNA (cytosine1402-N4)-methyltransferase|nr:16S rRNA (cytosine(1402)-N(4))-methyltransferase RsmH [Tannerella sp.]